MNQANDRPQHQPDWESLSEFNFLLYRRTVDGLNAALSALDVAAMPDKSSLPAEWWYARSRDKVEAVLNLSMAWSWLIQFKVGIELTQQVIRPFDLQEMLDWLTTNLQLRPALYYDKKLMLLGNKQSIQEAILMLHSVGGTLGRVRLKITPAEDKTVVAIMVSRLREQKPFGAVKEILGELGEHWRERTIAFELQTALDFLNMNKLALDLKDDGSTLQFSFTIPVANSKNKARREDQRQVQQPLVDTLPTVKLVHQQHWHLPAISHRADAMQLGLYKRPIIQAVPHEPQRTGGWHKPTPKRTMQIHDITHTPLMSARPAPIEPESPDVALNELEETGGQEKQDKVHPKGSVYDG